MSRLAGGEGGIRTPGEDKPHSGFRDRHTLVSAGHPRPHTTTNRSLLAVVDRIRSRPSIEVAVSVAVRDLRRSKYPTFLWRRY
jgi:hypothetical protein